jgi:lysophospholipase L1-like esterase
VSLAARKKRWLHKLGLAFGSFALCLLLFEAILRFNGYGNLEIYQPDPKLYWRLKPNQDCYTKVGHQPVHINSQGTRGPEFATAKPANTLRILSLGDSRTFGWGLPDVDNYSRRLERMLQEHFNGKHPTSNIEHPTSNEPTPNPSQEGSKRVEVINAGVNAWSFSQMQVFFRDVGLGWSPDFVILAEANLWTQFSERNSDEFVKKFMSRVRLKNLLRRSAIYHFAIEVKLQAFYQRYRTKFIPVDPKQDTLFKEQQQSDPDAVFRSAIEELCRVAGTNGVKPVLLFQPTLDDLSLTNLSHVLTVKQAVSAKLGVTLVDLTRDLTTGGKSLFLEADPVHLNAAGNVIVAERLFESVTNALAK